MWLYPWTHVGTPSHLGHMDRVAATMPSQAHAGAAQEAPDIGQWEGQDVPLVRPSSCNVKGGIPSSRRYLPTYLDTTGCEGRPPLSGHLLHVSGRLTSVSSVCRTVRCCWGVLRGCVPLGRRGRTCGQARLRVLGGRPMQRTGAPWRLLKFACTRAGRAARVSAAVRTAGCRQLPSASARI